MDSRLHLSIQGCLLRFRELQLALNLEQMLVIVAQGLVKTVWERMVIGHLTVPDWVAIPHGPMHMRLQFRW